MKPIIRNLVSVIRRFKFAVALNILGLSVAFAAFMLIMIQVDYDRSFDRFHVDSDKIFRVESYLSHVGGMLALVNQDIAEVFFNSSPHILASALVTPAMFGIDEAVFHIETDGAQNYFKEKVSTVTPGFFEVFTFDFVEGTHIDVNFEPGNVFIPLSFARKLFGDQPALGRQIVVNEGTQTVLGVYRDFPKNTIIENSVYFAMNPDEGNRGNFNRHAFVRLNDAANATLLIDNSMQNLDPDLAHNLAQFDFSKRLTALPDIHFTTDVQYDWTPKASRQTLMILFAIAIVIVVIAGINFTNFSTALTPMRIKNINIQRVVGAKLSTVRFAIVFEAVFISLLSYFVAILLVMLFRSTPAAALIDADLSLSSHSLIVGGAALVALLAGLFAGIYPSLYMTSFEPALVLKGSFGLTPKGRQLRNTLIGFQFIASLALIIGALFMYIQNRFMLNSDLGFDRDNLVLVDIGSIYEHRDAFANQVKSYSGVDDITFAQMPLSSDAYSKWGRNYKGELIIFQVVMVHHSFLRTMGIEITEGRDFRAEDEESQVWIFNESARAQFGLEVNTSFDGNGGEIIGFIPDLKIASFRMTVEPMAFVVLPQGWGNRPATAHIKLAPGVNLRTALSHINSTLAEFDANYIFEVRFFDEVLQRLYEKETAVGSLITLFSLMAIFISIVGVFGLVVFDSQYRRKEIGVRKVHGATTLSIIVMFNKAYFKILAVCFVIAAPLAWYAVNRWLENFAYKTPMHWWVYLLAFAAVAAVTVCTVTFQNWRVANDDPVNSLKSE